MDEKALDLPQKIGFVLIFFAFIALFRHAYIEHRRNNRRWGKGWRKKLREKMDDPDNW